MSARSGCPRCNERALVPAGHEGGTSHAGRPRSPRGAATAWCARRLSIPYREALPGESRGRLSCLQPEAWGDTRGAFMPTVTASPSVRRTANEPYYVNPRFCPVFFCRARVAFALLRYKTMAWRNRRIVSKGDFRRLPGGPSRSLRRSLILRTKLRGPWRRIGGAVENRQAAGSRRRVLSALRGLARGKVVDCGPGCGAARTTFDTQPSRSTDAPPPSPLRQARRATGRDRTATPIQGRARVAPARRRTAARERTGGSTPLRCLRQEEGR